MPRMILVDKCIECPHHCQDVNYDHGREGKNPDRVQYKEILCHQSDVTNSGLLPDKQVAKAYDYDPPNMLADTPIPSWCPLPQVSQ